MFMIVKIIRRGKELRKNEMRDRIPSPPICWNIILPFFIVIMGFQVIFLFIPIVLIEWVCAHILSSRIFHMDITKRYTLLVTFLSNLFSTLLGVIVILAIVFTGDLYRMDVLFNELIPSVILLYAFSILTEFFIVYFMFKRYLKKKADDEELEREDISKRRLIGISGIIVFAQNTLTYLFFYIFIMVISSPELI